MFIVQDFYGLILHLQFEEGYDVRGSCVFMYLFHIFSCNIRQEEYSHFGPAKMHFVFQCAELISNRE